MIRLTESVRLVGLKPEALLGIQVVASVLATYGCNCELLSVVDGDHDGGPLHTSSHYSGNAFDVSAPTRWLMREQLIKDLSACLGPEFNVVARAEHIHVAYIPQRVTG